MGQMLAVVQAEELVPTAVVSKQINFIRLLLGQLCVLLVIVSLR